MAAAARASSPTRVSTKSPAKAPGPTILISLIARDRQAYERLYNRGEVLKKQQRADEDIQRKAFWVGQLDRDGGSAVNDVLRYLSVSDSDPLSVDDLVLAKKYDKFSQKDDGRHKRKLTIKAMSLTSIESVCDRFSNQDRE